MRFLLKCSIPVEAGNASIRDGSLPQKIQSILEDLKPEAAYFTAEGGKRTAFLIVDMQDTSHMPAITEPWFLAFNASVEATPVMLPEDLERGGPGIEAAVKKYGEPLLSGWRFDRSSLARMRGPAWFLRAA